MGDNIGCEAEDSTEIPEELPAKNVFRFTVVEHVSWDSYDENKKCFIAGKKTNKPIAGRAFKIKLPDGSVIDKTTDADGVIELTERKSEDKFEVIFEPESAALNNKYDLFYNRCTPVDKKL